jgi:hypothetical protein
MNREELIEFFNDAVDEARQLIESKNHDYAGEDGDKPFANFTRVESLGITSTERGFLVRLTDKLSRLSSFCESGNFQVDESLRDTCLDIVNYSILYLAYCESQKAYLPTISTTTEDEDSFGVVYFALGFKDNGSMSVVDEAIQSAESLRKHSPDVPITLFTDEDVERPELFDTILPLRESLELRFDHGQALLEYADQCQSYRQMWMIYCGWKLHLISLSPYNRTLYLDTDTIIMQPIDDVFDLPNDLAAAIDYDCLGGSNKFNGGVIYFNGERGNNFARTWADAWYSGVIAGNLWLDQDAEELAFTLFQDRYEREVDFHVLDHSVWNVRPNEAKVLPVESRKNTKILHSRFHVLDDTNVWELMEAYEGEPEDMEDD